MMYQQLFSWAFAIGRAIVDNERYDKERGKDLLKRLIFDVRAEETPGRFLEKLSGILVEYKMNTNIQADVNLHPDLMDKKWHADSFYYMKSAILTGFLNVLSKRGDEE